LDFYFLEANRVLMDIDQVTKSESIDIALEFCSAFRRKDYIQFFILYKSLPKLACCLVDFFIDIYRKQMIEILIWGCVFIQLNFLISFLLFKIYSYTSD
jgi:hypothetical protein